MEDNFCLLFVGTLYSITAITITSLIIKKYDNDFECKYPIDTFIWMFVGYYFVYAIPLSIDKAINDELNDKTKIGFFSTFVAILFKFTWLILSILSIDDCDENIAELSIILTSILLISELVIICLLLIDSQ